MSKVKIRPWNSAEHLQSEEDIVAYLEACLEEGGDDDSQRMHDKGGIIPALFQASFQIGHYIFFRLKMLGRVPRTDFHFAHHSLYIEIRCKFARFEDISLLRGFAAAT